MEYIEAKFTIDPFTEENAEILTAWLEGLPFDSFSTTETTLNAYAPSSDFKEADLKVVLSDITLFKVAYALEIIPDQNWNKVWEKNYFEPIVVADKCLVRSTFHENTPKVQYEIVIDPKMAFGSGHHATTKMMLELILGLDLENKHVLDMGCGTGILAILAGMRKANPILAIDIDEWSYVNTEENAIQNNVKVIEAKQGDVSLLTGLKFDCIFANINRNVLLADMAAYVDSLPSGGILLLSGFMKHDKIHITTKAEELGLVSQRELSEKEWCSAYYLKA